MKQLQKNIFRKQFFFSIVLIFFNLIPGMPNEKTAIFWFRRDLRLEDNTGLFHALNNHEKVLPVFIFDTSILESLKTDDPRVSFIYKTLKKLHNQLRESGKSIRIFHGLPEEIWQKIITKYDVEAVYANSDYEPYALQRDQHIKRLLAEKNIEFNLFKDQVVFEKNEIVKDNKSPYSIYTPFKNKWRQKVTSSHLTPVPSESLLHKMIDTDIPFPSMEELSISVSSIKVKDFDLQAMFGYETHRDYPAKDTTSYLSPHLRFGTVGIRTLYTAALKAQSETFVNELIWREFFMQILFHFPQSVTRNFKPKYDGIVWRNKEEEFSKWCEGKTGYPIVDAGMRQLNKTGYMHNRVRMITASFLCKHLLIDWKWGEAYFAEKLLDFDLSANVGNWQWAAGTGCDAAPYFRVFNPYEQTKKFDPEWKYIRKWVDDIDELTYPQPMVEHSMARKRALETYKTGIAR